MELIESKDPEVEVWSRLIPRAGSSYRRTPEGLFTQLKRRFYNGKMY